jgi:CelD/BcsL family acetyltransferase involved in cellulose biosynthesis
MVFLESTPVGSPLWTLATDGYSVRDRFWVHRAAPVTTHRLVRMPGSFSEYLEQFSGKTRRVLAYKVRRLEKACEGRLRLETVTRIDQVGDFLERAGRVSERSWQGASLGKLLEADDAHLTWCREHAGRGWLRSYLLSDGDRPIAFVHGLQAEGTYYYDHVGYDHDYAEHRPGTALLYKLLQDLFEHDRPKRVDFRYGDSEYKKLFSNHAYEEANLYLLRRSAYTAVARATHAACDVVGRAVRAGLDRLGMRERARHLLRARALGTQAAADEPPETRHVA